MQIFATYSLAQNIPGNSKRSFKSISLTESNKRTYKSIPRSSDASDDLRLETVDDVLQSRARRERFESIVRNSIYFKYLSDAVDLREEYDYLFEDDDIAEKLVVYETLRVLSDKLKDTPIFEFYEDILDELKSIKDKTTVTIGKTSSGDFDIDSGKDKDDAFMKFKLHFNAARGVEPRLHFSENLALRHDILRNETLLEYRLSF